MTPWTVACQAPLSVVFSRQEYWSELLFPSPGDLPDPGFQPASLTFPAMAAGKPLSRVCVCVCVCVCILFQILFHYRLLQDS